MRKFLLVLLLCFCSTLALAQTYPLPDATVGTPYSLDLFDSEGLAQLLELFSQAGFTFSISFSVTNGSLPPGVNLSSLGVLAGTPTTAGPYSFTITARYVFIYMGETLLDESEPNSFSLQVVGISGPPASFDPAVLSFPFTQGSTAGTSQPITITNRSQQAQSVSATASTNSGGNWLTATSAGSVAPFTSGSVLVTANPSGLLPGTYTGTVSLTISPAGQRATVSVVATVSGGQRQIQLSQTGLRFQTLAGGGTPPSQSISVSNGGSGALNFNVSASTLSGGQGWLSVSPSSGSAGSSPATVNVNINPAGLQPGDYYGQVQVSAAGVDNSPQSASVVLNIAPATARLGAFVSTTGLIFVGSAGGTNPAAKTVSITAPSPTPLTINSAVTLEQGGKWLTVQTASGTVSATSPAQVSVQPTISGLAAGVYRGDVALYFTPDGTVRHVTVILVVVPGSIAGLPQNSLEATPMATCTPTKLVPVFTQLGSSFTTVAAWPTQVEVAVVDDCGAFMTSGAVVASFSSGDPPLTLLSLRDGRWSSTWQPRNSATQVTVTAVAEQTAPPIKGTASVGGTLASNPTTPVIGAGGVVSAAYGAKYQPVAPGSFISIYGLRLSSGLNQSPTLPLATQLGSTQAILAGRPLPLHFAADGQINAIVPYDVPPNTTQQLIVTNGPAISQPEPIVVSTVQPAAFTRGQAAIVVGVKSDGTQFLVDPSHPVSAGDVAVIYCAGLGAVDPPVQAGRAASLTVLSSTTNKVTVAIGSQPAQVLFSGLAPGFAGLYQVNAIVPGGITSGNDVPLVITVDGQSSPAVTIPVK